MSSSPSRILRKVANEPSARESAPSCESASDAIRVMIVDDSLTVRTVLKRIVESDGAMEVIATASSGERAIAQLGATAVDVLLLDLEMPGMGGLEALPTILSTAPDLQVLVVSSLTDDGAEATVEALSTGAADTMLKPRPGGFNEDYRSQLLGKIRALGGKNDSSTANANAQTAKQDAKPAATPRVAQRPELVAIGASTGGIHALNLMLRELTPDFDLPILITQHLPSSFIPVFARQVEVASGRPTHIADDGTEIRKGEIAIATGQGHMTVRRMGERLVARTSNEPARSGCLPSVDPMLRSAADACNGRVHAIILSGMGRDGFDGVQHLRELGGTVWTQDAETSAVWGMPGAVTKAGLSDYVAAPPVLGQALMTQVSGTGGRAAPSRENAAT